MLSWENCLERTHVHYHTKKGVPTSQVSVFRHATPPLHVLEIYYKWWVLPSFKALTLYLRPPKFVGKDQAKKNNFFAWLAIQGRAVTVNTLVWVVRLTTRFAKSASTLLRRSHAFARKVLFQLKCTVSFGLVTSLPSQTLRSLHSRIGRMASSTATPKTNARTLSSILVYMIWNMWKEHDWMIFTEDQLTCFDVAFITN